MRVIFLDIDGVLNSERYARKLAAKHRQLGHPEDSRACDCFKTYQQVDPDAIARLNRLVAATGAKIVVSSTWRKLFDPPELRRILEEHGLVAEIIGETPDGHHDEELRASLRDNDLSPERMQRGFEIDYWLRQHPEVDRFVILDDGSDMAMHKNRLVQTDSDDGLCDEHVHLATYVLAWDGSGDPPCYEEIAWQRPLTTAELGVVVAFADQVVARGLMSASSIEIETIRLLESAYRAHQAVLSEIRAIVDAAAVHSSSMPYVQAHSRIASMLYPMPRVRPATDEVARLRGALKEACDWAMPFDGRHDRTAGGYASEVLPMFTRVGGRTRTDRITALRKLADGLADEHDRERRLLLNLLAVIHRDGGHHTERVGLDQSVEDAHTGVAARHEALDEVARLREALKEACEMVVTTDHEGVTLQPAARRVAKLRKLAEGAP